MPHLLEIQGLRVHFDSPQGTVKAVDGVDLKLGEGQTLGLVGESGCGKSVTALSILRLITPPGRILGGSILFEGRDLMALPEREMRRVRGNRIGLVFQEPASALNPVLTVGYQVAESLIIHRSLSRREGMRQAAELFRVVSMPDPERSVRLYPHQLSGGQRQRVMIAMAIACRPALLIADEPTTALDVTIQAQILDLLRQLREEYRLSLLLISHDLGVIAEMADRVAVMYAGRIVEEAAVRDLFHAPRHPYTLGLMRSVPRRLAGRPRPRRLSAIPGSVPDLARLPGGCSFHPRCPDVMDRCHAEDPLVTIDGDGRRVACFKYP
jgi:oligopeptide/dipeptide ABC transporter ATP-binding protein